MIDDVYRLILGQIDAGGAIEVDLLGEECSFRAEELDPVTLPIDNVDAILSVHLDAIREL